MLDPYSLTTPCIILTNTRVLYKTNNCCAILGEVLLAVIYILVNIILSLVGGYANLGFIGVALNWVIIYPIPYFFKNKFGTNLTPGLVLISQKFSPLPSID